AARRGGRPPRRAPPASVGAPAREDGARRGRGGAAAPALRARHRGRHDDHRVRHPAVPPDRRRGARAAARARARGRAHLLHLPGRPRGPPAGCGHHPPSPPLRPRRPPRGDQAARPRVGPTRRHPRARGRDHREVQPARRSGPRRSGQAPRRRHRRRRAHTHDDARMEVEARPRPLSARAAGRRQSVLRFLAVMGPGIITANVDNDAGGITTYWLAGSRYLSVPLAAAFVWWCVVYGSYRRVEKVFLLACVFYLAYVASGVLAQPGWAGVLHESMAPRTRVDAAYVTMLVGLVGTTIAPWMQFYQQAAIVEKGVRVEDYPYSRLDVVTG